MRGFSGFSAKSSGMTPIPNEFFTVLLSLIEDVSELKVTLYCFYAIQQREGVYRFVRGYDLATDQELLTALHSNPDQALKVLAHGLELAVVRGTLLHAQITPSRGADAESIYFFNTERGRTAIAALDNGEWQPPALEQPLSVRVERPNIFKLYEQNIGVITPLLAEMLREAQDSFPAEWVYDAFKLALENNKRNWRYIEAILKRWSVEGRPNPSPGQPVSNNHYAADEVFPKDNFLDLMPPEE